jgi:hypothetical protein
LKTRHFVIPDTQVKAGVPLDHFRWLGQAIAEYQPDHLIHLGDHWDFQSVSRHSAPGSREKEGQRLARDIEAGNHALEALNEAMGSFRPRTATLLRGNHEYRLQRYVEANPVLEGIVGLDMLGDRRLGWSVVDYFHGSPKAIELDGLWYAHYFTNVNTGNPIGGNASYKLAAIGSPFVMGHVQGYDIGTKQYATGRTIRGIVAGSCYLHDEEYKGMANSHWRGAVVLNEVEKGNFSEMPLTIDYLCRKYEGMSVARFLQRKYKHAKDRFILANT